MVARLALCAAHVASIFVGMAAVDTGSYLLMSIAMATAFFVGTRF